MITLTSEQAQQIEEVLSGMLHGTDWNNGTHAKIYRPKFPEALATIHAAKAQEHSHPDDEAVDRFAAAMKAKLANKRSEGRGGWEDKNQCSAEFLNRLLNEHVGKGDPVDVGNLAMMLWNRGERTEVVREHEHTPYCKQAPMCKTPCGNSDCVEQAEHEPFDINDHPPHRLCECRKCMEYFTPLPDCDAFAASGKPIAEQEPVIDLSKVHHEDKCRYWDDETFCDCGADLYELLKWYRNKPVRTKDLTDDEIETIFEYWYSQPETEVWSTVDLARAVIAAYKEKNRG